MTQWAAFAGLTGVVCVLLLLLSHATNAALSDSPSDSDSPPESDPTPRSSTTDREHSSEADGSLESRPPSSSPSRPSDSSAAARAPASSDPAAHQSAAVESEAETEHHRPQQIDHTDPRAERSSERPTAVDEPLAESMSTGALLANVALSQGLFAVVLIAAALYTGIPAEALGIEFTRAYLFTGLALGTGVGVGLYVVNELGSVSAKRFGIDHSEELRELLAPDSLGGWAVLLVLVLPIIAVFEEFLFRAALIGAVSAGFDVSPWALAVVSSVAFALGHGMQGPAGIAVTGALGFVLAAVFIYTGSFLVVVLAHYLVNALEFVVHEGFGLEWGEPTVDSGTDADAEGDTGRT